MAGTYRAYAGSKVAGTYRAYRTPGTRCSTGTGVRVTMAASVIGAALVGLGPPVRLGATNFHLILDPESFTLIRLFSAAAMCLMLLTSVATAQQRDDAVLMFDANSLEGWRGRSDLWSVEDAAIVGRTTAESPINRNTFLIWEGEAPEDFELLVTYSIENGNSGIQYRSRVLDEKEFVVGGYQADIDASGKFTGINYEEQGRGILAQRGQRVTIAEDGSKKVEMFGDAEEIAKAFRPEGWNSYRVVARGNRLQHFINDELTSEVIDNQSEKAATKGVIALQLHVGPPMVVRFRDLKIRPLKD